MTVPMRQHPCCSKCNAALTAADSRLLYLGGGEYVCGACRTAPTPTPWPEPDTAPTSHLCPMSTDGLHDLLGGAERGNVACSKCGGWSSDVFAKRGNVP